jgi:5-formyltetrahydrofolate cyclo-ligase
LSDLLADLAAAKRVARAEAIARRRRTVSAGDAGLARQAAGHLLGVIGQPCGAVVSGYLPTGEELDPLPAMLALHGLGYRVCVPVTEGRGTVLRFRAWRPGVPTVPGPLRIPVPAEGDWLTPATLIVPLLAFDRRGHRLGYGGGYFDRTLATLRAEAPVRAIGFAFAAQEVDEVPAGTTDAHLDAVVTEAGVMVPD